jgi:hypothetical protein
MTGHSGKISHASRKRCIGSSLPATDAHYHRLPPLRLPLALFGFASFTLIARPS